MFKYTAGCIALVLVCLVGWSYVSRGLVEARALQDAACAAYDPPHGTCTHHDRRHVENLDTYCLDTERECAKSLLVSTLGRVADLALKDLMGVESRAEFGLWVIMGLSSPATWSVLIGLAAMCVIVSYARTWMRHGKEVVGATVKRIGGDDHDTVSLPVAAPVVMFGGPPFHGSPLKSKQH